MSRVGFLFEIGLSTYIFGADIMFMSISLRYKRVEDLVSKE